MPVDLFSPALGVLLEAAAAHVPYYHDQAWARRLRNGKRIAFRVVPVTPKEAVRGTTPLFHNAKVPAEHGQRIDRLTSGSTGTPLLVIKTGLHFHWNALENQRLAQGWNLDKDLRVVASRTPPSEALRNTEQESRSGNRLTVNVFSLSVGPQAAALRRIRATRFHTRPSIALGVLSEHPDIDFLRLVCTISETVPPALRALISRLPDCRLHDSYGSVESGIIGATCPRCGQYHLAHHHCVIELLDDDGHPAAPGDIGRVVLTPLFNHAMPLLRYDIGDYAVRSAAGACDGTGMAFERIVGKQRDLFKLPGGEKILPYVTSNSIAEMGIRLYRLVQTSLTEVEFRYVPEEPAREIDPAVAQRIVDSSVSPKLRAICVRVSELPLKPDAKYVWHESLI